MRYVKWLINDNLSCYYDSFFSIFVFNIIHILKKNENYNNISTSKNNIKFKNFKNIIKFSVYLIQNINSNFLYFFKLYKEFQNNIGAYFLLIDENEIGEQNSLTNCYRPLYDIEFFIFKYKEKHHCIGNCKFANTIEEIKITAPFLEFTENYLNDVNIKNVGHFIIKGYFKNRNVLLMKLNA